MKERLRVLYAEDNPSDADLTKSHFELNAPEIALDVVDTGKRFLSRLKEAEYDVLLLDNRLPDMDGIAILKLLAEKGDSPPVVMVTAVGDEALVVDALRLGACDYLPKQGDYLTALPEVLDNVAAERRNQQEQGYDVGRRQKRILYVEHNSSDIDLTLNHFATAAVHFSVEVARSSEQALELLREEKFDLVLADLRMPDMNALELLKKTKHSGRPVPFIVVTGKGDEAAAVGALRLGAFDYIVKRDNYLTQLPYAIENAITRSHLAESNQRLRHELAQRERAEAGVTRLLSEVQSQRQRMADIVESVQGVVWETSGPPDDPARKMEFVSSYVKPMLGYTVQQCLSTPGFWMSIVHPEDRERVARETAESFTSGNGVISQFRAIAADGRAVWIEARYTAIPDDKGNPVGIRGVSIDITASKEAEQARALLEEQLRQSHKMESIGRLAGGVAHDFNNLLTTINGYAELMLGDLEPGDPLRATLSQIRKAGERAAELTHQLLAFSRRQMLQPRHLALNDLIEQGADMLKRLLGEDVELVCILDPKLRHVRADAGQIHQVLLNIAINARDAMPHGGRLTLETQNVTIDAEYARTHPPLRRGSYVLLSMSDTGLGMDAETKSRIFEPFFTTKAQGEGTGLGLSMVEGIIEQSGGSILVDSSPGQGATFRIYLPQVEEPAAEPDVELAEPDSLRGVETVFVVEDEEMVRKLTCQVLRGYGYQVIEAANAGEALLACEQYQGAIHLMIADVVMPRMGGPELADRLRRLRPEMQVLFMSGYTDAAARQGILGPGMSFIQKPFTPGSLAQKVRGILDQRSTPTAR